MFFEQVSNPLKDIVNPLLGRIVKHVASKKHEVKIESLQRMCVARTAQQQVVVRRLQICWGQDACIWSHTGFSRDVQLNTFTAMEGLSAIHPHHEVLDEALVLYMVPRLEAWSFFSSGWKCAAPPGRKISTTLPALHLFLTRDGIHARCLDYDLMTKTSGSRTGY